MVVNCEDFGCCAGMTTNLFTQSHASKVQQMLTCSSCQAQAVKPHTAAVPSMPQTPEKAFSGEREQKSLCKCLPTLCSSRDPRGHSHLGCHSRQSLCKPAIHCAVLRNTTVNLTLPSCMQLSDVLTQQKLFHTMQSSKLKSMQTWQSARS